MRQRSYWDGLLSSVLAIAVSVALPGCAYAQSFQPVPPFVRPFAADKKGSIYEAIVLVKEHRNYWLFR